MPEVRNSGQGTAEEILSYPLPNIRFTYTTANRTSTETPTTARFPGQWYQSESGLHQNWMRDYDPTTGRYLQGDPLGLIDGASVYGYARQNPGRWVDFMGLEVQMCCRPAQIAGGIVKHCWVKTDTIEAGMGANPDVLPGQEYEGWGMPVQILDHSKDTPTECTKMNNVEEQCVNDQLIIGKPIGRFTPPFNQCQAFAYGVINRCRYGPQN